MPNFRPTPQREHRGRGRDVPPGRDPWEGLADVIDVPLEKLRTAMARSARGVSLQGAEVRQLRAGGTGQVSGSAGRLTGWSMRETTGTAPATVYLRDGRGPDGALVAVVQLPAGASTTQSTAAGSGLSVNEGVYVDVAAGVVEGAVYLGATD